MQVSASTGVMPHAVTARLQDTLSTAFYFSGNAKVSGEFLGSQRKQAAGPSVSRSQQGVTAMTGPSWNRKVLMLVLSVLACATVAISIGIAYPIPVESPALGSEWRCQRSVSRCPTVPATK